jgi:hypothetical protein
MGKKIALLIGNNYIGTQYQLYGCQNDVIKYKTVLINNFGYVNEDIKLLMDLNGYEYPTKANIIKYMDLIYQQTCIPNLIIDEIIFYYSGHGTNIKDKDADEPDGMDECIVPLDFSSAGLITDDYIYGNFLSKLKTVKKIICIFDSCNSASCTDLPYSFTVMNNKLVKQYYSKRPQISNNPNIFVLSGCLDPKTSLDSREPDGTPCGLLSYWLRLTLAKYNYKCSIENLLTNIKIGFGKNDQTPVISVNSNDFVLTSIVFDNTPKPTNPTNPPNPPKPTNPPNPPKPTKPTKPQNPPKPTKPTKPQNPPKPPQPNKKNNKKIKNKKNNNNTNNFSIFNKIENFMANNF